MIQQIKKMLCLGVVAGMVFHPLTTSTELSDVAGQSSVIDEQAMLLPLAGVSLAVCNSNTLAFSEEGNDATTTSIAEEQYQDGWINTDYVNLRAEADVNSESLMMLQFNTHIRYYTIDDEWSKVVYNEDVGFMKTEFISVTEYEYNNKYDELITNASDYERELILKTTYAEAGNQSIEGQRAVIEIILNRVLSERYPDTITGVLSQSGQFETWNYVSSVVYNETQEQALELVCTNQSILNENYLMFSKGQNSWGRNYIKIGDHWFGTF